MSLRYPNAPQSLARPQVPSPIAQLPVTPPLPPDVQAKLNEAVRNGSFWIAVCVNRGGPNSEIEVFQHRSGQFNEDLIPRCIRTMIGQLFTPPLPQAPAVQQHAPPHESTLG